MEMGEFGIGLRDFSVVYYEADCVETMDSYYVWSIEVGIESVDC